MDVEVVVKSLTLLEKDVCLVGQKNFFFFSSSILSACGRDLWNNFKNLAFLAEVSS